MSPRNENPEKVDVSVSTEDLAPASAPEAPAAPESEPSEDASETDPESEADTGKEPENASVSQTVEIPVTVNVPVSGTVTAEITTTVKDVKNPGKNANAETAPAKPAKDSEDKKAVSGTNAVKVKFLIDLAYGAKKYRKGDVDVLSKKDLKNLLETWYEKI